MKSALIVSVFLIVALLGGQRLLADPQSGGSGVLTGVVIGPDDKPVAHALVTYQSGGGSAPHVMHADAEGHFSIPKLRSDNYELRASGRGVLSPWKNIAVRSGRTKAVTLRLVYAKQILQEYKATRTYEPKN
jgi:Carboxypeptidase regulatory-like domain